MPIQTLLEAIQTKEKWLIPQLRPPAAKTAIQRLQALNAPDLMVSLYATHDGTEHELFGSYRLLPIETIIRERQNLEDISSWDPTWIPFLSDGDGQFYCVDPNGAYGSGLPGQIIFYDHETGPQREFASFEVLVGFLTKLAKAKLFDQEAQQKKPEKYDELYSTAKYLGLPKMSAKERKAILAKLSAPSLLSNEEQLDLLLPLLQRYPVEGELWGSLVYVAAELERWPLLVEAAAMGNRFAPRGYSELYTDFLVLGLHQCGRDEEALAALQSALKKTQNPQNEKVIKLVPTNADPAFRIRALSLMTSVIPLYFEGWFMLGSESTDPAIRTHCFKEVIRLVNDDKNPNSVAERRRTEAKKLLGKL